MEGGKHGLVVDYAYHHPGFSVQEGDYGIVSQDAGQYAVVGRGRSAPLDMSQRCYTRFVIGEPFLDLGCHNGRAALFPAYVYDDDPRGFALTPFQHQALAELADVRLHLGDHGGFCSCGNRGVQCYEPGVPPHHLDKEHHVVRIGRVA